MTAVLGRGVGRFAAMASRYRYEFEKLDLEPSTPLHWRAWSRSGTFCRDWRKKRPNPIASFPYRFARKASFALIDNGSSVTFSSAITGQLGVTPTGVTQALVSSR